MPKLREAPTDCLNIPLPIIPSEDFPNIPSNSQDMTKHHEYFLYGPQRFISPGGIAVRLSRVLRAEAKVHNNGPGTFHNFYDISSGPSSDKDKISVCIYGDAGYIPETGIDLWSGSPMIREMEDGERAILQTIDPKSPSHYQNLLWDGSAARKFYERMLLKERIDQIDPDDLEKFASTLKFKNTRDIGHAIIQSLVESVALDVQDGYQNARNEGLLHPLAPADPVDLVFRVLGDEGKREQRLFHLLRRKAILQARIGDISLQTGVDTVQLAA